MKPFAVLVLNWNGLELLKTFVPLWLSYAQMELSELIIIDNGSTDSSVTYLEQEYPELKLIKFDENYGFSEGYNRAIAMVDNPYVVLLNSDATPLDKHWLGRPFDLLESNADIVAVQPKIKSYREQNKFEYAGAAGGYIDILGYPYCRGRIFDTVEEDLGQYDLESDIHWASGASLIIRREEYLKVGGLDKDFFAHQEEIDLCQRLRMRAWRIVYTHSSEVFHIGGASLDMKNPRKLYLNFRNNLLMLYKNLPTFHFSFIFVMRLALDIGAMLGFLVKREFPNARAVVKAYWHFLSSYRTFKPKRKENLTKSKSLEKPLFSRRSIILDYYLRGRKTF